MNLRQSLISVSSILVVVATLFKIWPVPKRPISLEPRFLLMIRLMLASMQLKYCILAKMYLLTGRCIPTVVWALPAHRPQPESRLSALTCRLEVSPRNTTKSGNSGQSQKDTNHKFANYISTAIHPHFGILRLIYSPQSIDSVQKFILPGKFLQTSFCPYLKSTNPDTTKTNLFFYFSILQTIVYINISN